MRREEWAEGREQKVLCRKLAFKNRGSAFFARAKLLPYKRHYGPGCRLGFIDELAFSEGLDDERVFFFHHRADFFRRVHEDIGVDARGTEPGHGLKSLDKGFLSVLDDDHIEIALCVSLSPSGRTEEDDLMRLVRFQRVEQNGKRFIHRVPPQINTSGSLIASSDPDPKRKGSQTNRQRGKLYE
jgi:hypothetical protein